MTKKEVNNCCQVESNKSSSCLNRVVAVKECSDDGKRKWRLVSQWEKEETDFEKYLRIKEANAAKEKKASDRAIKKLKKEGKVQSIAGFLLCKKDDDDDDDWMKSKKDKFQNQRSIRKQPNLASLSHKADIDNTARPSKKKSITPFLNARTHQPIVTPQNTLKKNSRIRK